MRSVVSGIAIQANRHHCRRAGLRSALARNEPVASWATPVASVVWRRAYATANGNTYDAMSESQMENERAHLQKLKQQVHEDDGSTTEPVTEDEAEQLWLRGMEAKYGEGTYQLFRPLYKDLCDEMRREYFTKPPPPFTHEQAKAQPAQGSVPPKAPSATFVPSAAAPEGASPVTWQVAYQPANNCVVFRRDAVPALRQARVVAYSKIEITDPPRLNALLTFADWVPIEVMMERRGVIVHFSVACNEGGMHMRNVRVYRSPDEEVAEGVGAETATEAASATSSESHVTSTEPGKVPAESVEASGPRFTRKNKADQSAQNLSEEEQRQRQQHPTPYNVLDATDDAEWCRQNLCYDGPCLWHLELDFLNELYDVMQDHGVTLEWIRWASEWVYYLEHANYARWSVGMLEELVPTSQRGPETDFLTLGEREALDEPAEDWLSARAI